MALSQTEKNRRYRAKLRSERAAAKKLPVEKVKQAAFRTPFHDWLDKDTNWSEVELAFMSIGLEPPRFDDDRGAFSLDPDQFEDGNWFSMQNPYAEAFNSFGRATMMVGVLVDVAASFASLLNRYMREELQARLAELEGQDLPPEVAQLTRERIGSMLDSLDKPEVIRMKKWKI